MSLGSTFNGTFTGNGQAQLFRVSVPSTQVLSIDLKDPSTGDSLETYDQFGRAPTREVYDYRSDAPGNSQKVLIPSAHPGDWYVLVYSAKASAGSTFTLTAQGTVAKITSVTPDRSGNAAPHPDDHHRRWVQPGNDARPRRGQRRDHVCPDDVHRR